MAGMLPKKINVKGRSSHCKSKEKSLLFPIPFGFGGKIKKLRIQDARTPTIDIVIRFLVAVGRLYDKRVMLKLSPPKNNGNQPKKKINKETVAQDKKPSKISQE